MYAHVMAMCWALAYNATILSLRFILCDFFSHLMMFSWYQSMVMGDSPTIMAAHEDVGDDAQQSIEAMEDA
jgi:hypothetical protein